MNPSIELTQCFTTIACQKSWHHDGRWRTPDPGLLDPFMDDNVDRIWCFDAHRAEDTIELV
ncbi:unnamed protein product [Fusarium graminearum]|nr:unnamed protein product [Fusarium graminearum]CAG1961891.1 unnamed protein product [Fusarium graminearum]VTO86315.1 unnamed protein product [Fusarium graminearum]